MKKRLFSMLSILFFGACQSSTVTQQEKILIDENQIVIKYLNFTPQKVDRDCMKRDTKKLFQAIKNGETSIYPSIFFINHEHYKRVSSAKSLIFENQNENIFILLPIEQNLFFLSTKAFDDKNDETFSMYELKNKIDFKQCINQ
ncbi:hypothetical protein MNB_SV-13-531 [hydrothermal vent metagenome]|uniref:Lipoprotein n=1 Tax=hydrothermal vent metagenome TaxID=652676 RepID=A0A1W1CW85_9ZZZZ